MRDHKIALFKAKEDDLAAELAEKAVQLEELEVSSCILCAELSLRVSRCSGVSCGSQHFFCSPTRRRYQE